ncbi:MAG: hypothetical protein Q9217_002911, partial [Psora testacea]
VPSKKKTTGKKAKESKKEIGSFDWTNREQPWAKKGAPSNELEASDNEADKLSNIKDIKSSKAAMSCSKNAGKASSVLQRVKEIEKEKANANTEEPLLPPPPTDPEPISKSNKKGASKTKDTAASKNKTNDSAFFVDKKKKLFGESVVPGSFPGEGMDDELINLEDLAPFEEQSITNEEDKDAKAGAGKESKTKGIKTSSKEKSSAKAPPTPPPEPYVEGSDVEEPPVEEPPMEEPPVEKPKVEKPKVKKPAKKERPRIAKGDATSSWGLWGAATPKKEVKKSTRSKDDADLSPPAKKERSAASALNRSKSTRTPKEKDKETEKSNPKSSDSEKPKKKAESRPPNLRGSSFGAFFGAVPPSRTKSVRRSSTVNSGPKAAAGRPSVDLDGTGLPSPPLDDGPRMSVKAAKLMGTDKKLGRKESTKGKIKASGEEITHILEVADNIADNLNVAAPDPYPIDDDDMVMVSGLEDPVVNAPVPKKDNSSKSQAKTIGDPDPYSPKKDLPDRTRTKHDSNLDSSSKAKHQSKAANDVDDDVVMVDAGPSDGLDVADGPENLAFVTKPKGLQRSNTTSKKPESRRSGLFGAFRKSRRASEAFERSRAVIEDEVTPRKRTATAGDDSAKRPRRDERRKSTKMTDREAGGYVYNTAPADAGAATEAEEVDARKEERRAKREEDKQAAKLAREAELQAIEERRVKRRKAERDAEKKALEDREARRAARRPKMEETPSFRRAKEEEAANKDLADEVLLKPRTTYRVTDSPSRPRHSKSDRRISYLDPLPTQQTPEDEAARSGRRDERRAKGSRRKSTAATPAADGAPMADYFDSRNGKTRNVAEENDPYGGNDHTSSWVKSQISDPPAPPPVEGTILEPEPVLGEKGGEADDLLAEEDIRHRNRKKRRGKMYADPMADDQEERRRRRKERERDSDGSAEGGVFLNGGAGQRRKSQGLSGVKLGTGEKTWDARTGQGKRSSWFQKFKGGFD